uniref:Uncharacterized protein n=1 Tax=viral metagenome TaxID=1070528 RepID=A0A6C0DFW8_9ZZZZ
MRFNIVIDIFNTIIKTRIANITNENLAIKLLEFKKSFIPLPLPAVLFENGFHIDDDADDACDFAELFILSYIYIIKEKAIITK